VRSIKKPTTQGVKRVNINIPIETHNSFKAAAALKGEDMTTVLLRFIEDYVQKSQTGTTRKGRRK
jgi:hypothetical protein